MNPLFADSIDIPMALGAGFIVLVPLIAFEVFVEALVLKKAWRLPYGSLCAFAFFTNCFLLKATVEWAMKVGGAVMTGASTTTRATAAI